MVIFKKNETPIQNLAFMALMAAINVVFVLLATLVPVLFLLLIFVLPLTSVLVTLYCKKRFFLIYAVATIALCLGATFWDLSNTLFYVIPSIVSGFLFGLLAERKCPSIFLILIPAFIQVIFTYVSIPLINFIYSIDTISTFIAALGLQANEKVYIVVPSAIFLFSIIQSTLSYMIIRDELPKFKIVLKENHKFYYWSLIGEAISLVCLGAFAPFFIEWSYFSLMVAIFFGFFLLVDSWNDKKIWIFVSEGVSFVVTFFLFSSLYSIVGSSYGFLLIGIFPLLVSVIASCNMYLSNRKNKDTIKPKGKING